MYAIKIPPIGKPEMIDFPSPKEATDQYRIMSETVGGYIEAVTVRIGEYVVDIWVNEEGLLKRLPYNGAATYIYEQSSGSGALLVGDAIVTGTADREGNTLPLTRAEADAVLFAIQQYTDTFDLA